MLRGCMSELVCKCHLQVVHLCYVNSCHSAAYKNNSAKEFDKQPAVYALLTDLRDSYFLRYDGSKIYSLSTRNHWVYSFAVLDGMRSGTFPYIIDQ